MTCTFHSRVLVSPSETVILYPAHYQLLSPLPHSCHAPGSNVVWWSRADLRIGHIPGVVSQWQTRHKHRKWFEDMVEVVGIYPAVPPPAPEKCQQRQCYLSACTMTYIEVPAPRAKSGAHSPLCNETPALSLVCGIHSPHNCVHSVF